MIFIIHFCLFVRRTAYPPIPLLPGERLSGQLCDSCGPELRKVNAEGEETNLEVAYEETVEPAVWDAPDIVWLVGLLPAEEISRGIGTALMAGTLPTLLYYLIKMDLAGCAPVAVGAQHRCAPT
ncbi:MAG TPA: hypothetical protein EYH27_04720, partial [Anaerolineales bacterium]|nr:hypothetical protein [Anaerolineales bacterium]